MKSGKFKIRNSKCYLRILPASHHCQFKKMEKTKDTETWLISSTFCFLVVFKQIVCEVLPC